MKTFKSFLVSLACLLFLIVSPSGAATVQYNLGGELTGYFGPISDDPYADLFNVPRNSQNTMPFNLQLVVEMDSVPYVENDNSIFQQVTYRDAIVSSTLDINGTEFRTIRSPMQSASPVPPPQGDEASISMINRLAPGTIDNLTINVGHYQREASSLYNTYTVPVNQTIDGTFYDNVEISLFRNIYMLSFFDLLDGIDLPADGPAFDTQDFYSAIQVDLTADWGNNVPDLLTLGGSVDTFNVSPVPVPAAVWLLGSGVVGLIGFRRKIKS